ncbi:MAG: DUF3768 domain-containing protein [Pseudorhodoplanes sp.]
MRALNDAFRKALCSASICAGKVVMTRGVQMMPRGFMWRALEAVQKFDAFTRENDPHGEHDFVSVEVDGHLVFGKIDYYDKDLVYGSEDPSDPEVTTRVLTVMLADEY